MSTLQDRLRAMQNKAAADAADRLDELEAALEQARVALEEMQYARTDKAERLAAEALRKIEEARRG